MTASHARDLGHLLLFVFFSCAISTVCLGCEASRTGTSSSESVDSNTSTNAGETKDQEPEESQEESIHLGLEEIEYPVVSDFFKAYNDISESPVEYVEESDHVDATNDIVVFQTMEPNDKTYVGTSHNGTKITVESFQEDEGRFRVYIEPNEGNHLYTADVYRTFIDAMIAMDPDTTADDASAIWQQIEKKRGNNLSTKFYGSTSNASFSFVDTRMTVRQDSSQYHPLTGDRNSTGAHDSGHEYDIGACYISIDNVADSTRIGKITSPNEVTFSGVPIADD